MFAIPVQDSKVTASDASRRATVARISMLNGFSIYPTAIISCQGLRITFVPNQPGVTISFENDKGFARAYVHGKNMTVGEHGSVTGDIMCNECVIGTFVMEHRKRYRKLALKGLLSTNCVCEYSLYNGDFVRIEVIPLAMRAAGARLGSSVSRTGIPKTPRRVRRQGATTIATALRPKGGIRKHASPLSTSSSALEELATIALAELLDGNDSPYDSPQLSYAYSNESSDAESWSMSPSPASVDGAEAEMWLTEYSAEQAMDAYLAIESYLAQHPMQYPQLDVLPEN
eukprot:TRINITY_DN466_c0_g1_i1.p1 TRINITY_DN466_c0_g1~~TRINITY_DN466_c0_g1_i1.p1  ORF type:complete len:286 (+),score=53.53 TRINITY_DN466_c0_g1_i1:96-953(+)